MRLRAQLVALWRGDIPLGQALDDGINTERSPDTGGSGLLRFRVPQEPFVGGWPHDTSLYRNFA